MITVYLVNGYPFYPQNTLEMKHCGSKNYCNNLIKTFYINGIEINEAEFCHLNLKQKNTNRFQHSFDNQDTTQCIDRISFFLSLHIPIRLKGVQLTETERETILKNNRTKKLTSIKRRKNIFGKSSIVIKTK